MEADTVLEADHVATEGVQAYSCMLTDGVHAYSCMPCVLTQHHDHAGISRRAGGMPALGCGVT